MQVSNEFICPTFDQRSTVSILGIKEDLLKLLLDERFEEAKELLESARHLVDINYDDGYLIYMAAKLGKLETVKFLVENGADFRICDETTLKTASGHGHFDIVRYLLSKGSNPKVLIGSRTYNQDPNLREIVEFYLKK